MRIDRMQVGKLYEIKENTHLEFSSGNSRTGPNREYRVLRGWRSHSVKQKRAPFVYLGHKTEEWRYNYLNTHKIHYVLYEGDIWVMDNQFAKHIVPVWDGAGDG